MSILGGVLTALAAMFRAGRRLNLGLLSATMLAAAIGIVFPALRTGILPVLMTLAYAGVIVWALAPPGGRGDRHAPSATLRHRRARQSKPRV